MANITIAANAAVIKSDLKVKDIEVLEKYNPAELVLMGGKDDEEEIFSIGLSSGKGSLSPHGATFSKTGIAPQGAATITIDLPNFGSADEAKGYIADKYGVALDRLAQLEAKVPEKVTAFKAKRDALIAQINVAGTGDGDETEAE